MGEKGLTTMNLKQINRSKVYQYIYKNKETSKLQIVQDLQMGLSTVSQNLKLLEEEGLIERNGYFESTGGRKAQAIRIVPDYKLAIGIGLLKDLFHITVVDLYGRAVHTESFSCAYSDSPDYYLEVTNKIQNLIDSQYQREQILGISFAIQGITSADNTTVTYGRIMDNTGMKIESFSHYLPYLCRLEHDSKSAATLELWNHPELDSALVVLLNRNLGGAIITHHQLHRGSSMHSGAIEHICIDPEGPLCYCGRQGCLETYCSANALEQAADLPIKEFFAELREKKSSRLIKIWEDYLKHLSLALRNLNLVIDAPIILSGYLAPYFTLEDIRFLIKNINDNASFPLSEDTILIGGNGQYTPAIGAALYDIKEFLSSI